MNCLSRVGIGLRAMATCSLSPAHRTLIVMALIIVPMKGAEIPRQSPEFQINLPDGKYLLLSQYRGKAVVLEFLVTTCPHCQFTSAILERLYKEYKGHGLEVFGVAINENALKLVPDFIQKEQLTYKVGASEDAKAKWYLQRSPILITYVPQLVFIDRKGVIRAQYDAAGDFPKEPDQEKTFRAEIEKLLSPHPVAKKRP